MKPVSPPHTRYRLRGKGAGGHSCRTRRRGLIPRAIYRRRNRIRRILCSLRHDVRTKGGNAEASGQKQHQCAHCSRPGAASRRPSRSEWIPPTLGEPCRLPAQAKPMLESISRRESPSTANCQYQEDLSADVDAAQTQAPTGFHFHVTHAGTPTGIAVRIGPAKERGFLHVRLSALQRT